MKKTRRKKTFSRYLLEQKLLPIDFTVIDNRKKKNCSEIEFNYLFKSINTIIL